VSRKIRKFTATASVTLFLLLLALLTSDGLIMGSSLRHFSRAAQSQFPGKRVEALIALVNCQSCDIRERNNAVWALGQLDDPRALPVLESCYTGDHCGNVARKTLRIALRHLRHEDRNRSESFLWRWMLPNES
jgi:PBS lyase HEAT-like repeat